MLVWSCHFCSVSEWVTNMNISEYEANTNTSKYKIRNVYFYTKNDRCVGKMTRWCAIFNWGLWVCWIFENIETYNLQIVGFWKNSTKNSENCFEKLEKKYWKSRKILSKNTRKGSENQQWMEWSNSDQLK